MRHVLTKLSVHHILHPHTNVYGLPLIHPARIRLCRNTSDIARSQLNEPLNVGVATAIMAEYFLHCHQLFPHQRFLGSPQTFLCSTPVQHLPEFNVDALAGLGWLAS